MSCNIDQAIAKITKEALEIGHPYATFLEEHLTELCTTESVAKKLLQPNKHLKEHVDAVIQKMRNQAKQNQKGNTGTAGISDKEAYWGVEAYYGITQEATKKADIIDLSSFL